MSPSSLSSSARLGALLRRRGWRVTTAESCTGGGIASAITDIPGSSAWFEAGFVTYSNAAKQTLLGVPATLFSAEHSPGAVSEETVTAMALGALHAATAQIAVATSGIAGPDGGSETKPVGTVWLAWAWQTGPAAEQVRATCFHFAGDRQAVRQRAIEVALEGLLDILISQNDGPQAGV